MIEETYPYFPIKDDVLYGFVSEGVRGAIFKLIIFTPLEDNEWNLAFGDWRKDNLDDKIMTNNQDVVRVIGTVTKVAFNFFNNHPDATLVIKPVDEKRKRLYNIVFRRHHEAINKSCIIWGMMGEIVENYLPQTTYDSFKISLKSK
jgi:hypothetical protein